MNRNYCSYCGCEIKNRSINYCVNCGYPINAQFINNNSNNIQSSEDNNSFLWGLVGFFIPLGGLIIFLLWLNEKPKAAKGAGLGALIRVIITFFLIMILIIGAIISIDKEENHNSRDGNPYHEETHDDEDWT